LLAKPELQSDCFRIEHLDHLALLFGRGNERYGNGLSEHPTAENYTHTFQHHEQEAAEKLGQLFGTVWPEIDKEKLISFPNLSLAE